MTDALIGYDVAIAGAQNALDAMRAPRWALSDVDDYKDTLLGLRTAVGDARTALRERRGVEKRVSAVGRAERAHLRSALALQRRVARRGGSGGGDPA